MPKNAYVVEKILFEQKFDEPKTIYSSVHAVYNLFL